jgi:tetratricopeptide (TPR) repeat protein
MIRRVSILVLALSTISAQRLTKTATTDDRIAMAERRVKQSPSEPAVLDELAGAYLQKMRETADGAYLERVSRLVSASLKADPSNYAALRRQVEIEMQRHHFKQAVALTDTLLKQQPGDTVVWGLRGDAYMELGQYDSAETAYQRMADLRPGLASYNRIGFFRFITGDAEGAIQIIRQGIGIGGSPENLAWCWADLGNMLFKTGVVGEAENAYRHALAEFPGYHLAQAGLGRVHLARGQYADAIQALLKAQAQAPFPEYAGLLAKLYRKTGEIGLAQKQIALLDVADKLDQAAGEAANRNLSLAFSDLEHRPARALALANAELEVRRDVYSYDALAWALFKNGRVDEAAAAIESALANKTPEPSFYEHAARIYEAAGRAEAARRHHARAMELNAKFDIF